MSEEFAYTMKSIPTVYAGVKFRSRLEARWAAFFDLRGIEWDYEPIDFDGWAPDFRLKLAGHDLFAEVKPFDLGDGRLYTLPHKESRELLGSVYGKALAHRNKVWVILLGMGPPSDYPGTVGWLEDDPKGRAARRWDDAFRAIATREATELWRRSGNKVQWNPD